MSLILQGQTSVYVIGIVVSQPDPASETIGQELRSLGAFEATSTGFQTSNFELRMFEERHLDLVNVAEAFTDPDLIVFVSRHAGATGNLLTAHIPGNVGSAAYGGEPRSLPVGAPAALRSVYHSLCEFVPAGYNVALECTHHGPSDVGAPCLFVEVGSDESAWTDPVPANSVARAVLALAEAPLETDQIVVGFGGDHYVPRYERIVRETGWAVGHIAADWALEELAGFDDRERTISDLFKQSGSVIAHLETEEEWVKAAIETLGHRIVSERWLREADGVSLALVDRIESLLGPVDTGTQIGEQIDVSPTSIEPHRLSDALVSLLNGTDPVGAIDCLRRCTTGYARTDGGGRVDGMIARPKTASPDEFVAEIEPFLAEYFDTFTVGNGVIAGTYEQFDPEAARQYGVPEGPAFGQLASGDSLEVNETTIEPEDVMKCVTEEIPIFIE